MVIHRPMQRHGNESQVPIRQRTCPACQVIFKSKLGLLQHQSRKTNVLCFRAGRKNLRYEWQRKKMDFHSTWKKKTVNDVHNSVSEEYRRGKAIRKEVKQTCLNVYQYLR